MTTPDVPLWWRGEGASSAGAGRLALAWGEGAAVRCGGWGGGGGGADHGTSSTVDPIRKQQFFCYPCITPHPVQEHNGVGQTALLPFAPFNDSPRGLRARRPLLASFLALVLGNNSTSPTLFLSSVRAWEAMGGHPKHRKEFNQMTLWVPLRKTQILSKVWRGVDRK